MQLSELLTALFNEWQTVTSGFCSTGVTKYWKGRRITDSTLDHFDVRYNPRSRSLTSILRAKGFPIEEIKTVLYGKSGKRELFGKGSIIPLKSRGGIWDLMWVGLTGAKLYCSSIKLQYPFNVDDALQSDGPVTVCEAPIDAISAWQLGTKSVISSLGTGFEPLDFSMFTGRQLTTVFDNDDAGRKAAEKFRLKYPGSRSAFVPAPYKDINEFLVGGGTPEQLQEIIRNARNGTTTPIQPLIVPAAAPALPLDSPLAPIKVNPEPLIVSATPVSKPIIEVPDIKFFENNPDLFFNTDSRGKVHPRTPEMFELHSRFTAYCKEQKFPIIFDKARQSGSLFLDNNVITICQDDIFCRNFFYNQIRRFSMSGSKGKEFLAGLNDFLANPKHSKIVESAYYACFSDGACFYHMGNDHILKVAPNSVVMMKNGDNEFRIGLLPPTLPFKPWTYIPHATKESAVKLLKELYVDCIALDKVDRIPSLAFNLTHLIPDLALRPLRENTGIAGSGKTEESRLFSLIITGESNIASFKSEVELLTIADRNPISICDNLEPERASRFLETFAMGATGGSGTRRKLYTDETMLRYKFNSLIVKTCIRSTQDGELVQRFVTFEFDPKFHSENHNGQLLREKILQNRDILLSGIFQILAEDVLPQLSNYDSFADRFLKMIQHPRKRLNPFFRIMILWVAAICKYLGEDWEKVAKEFFEKSARQYESDVADSDPFVQSLIELKDTAKSAYTGEFKPQTRILPEGNGRYLIISGRAADFFQDFLKLNRHKTEQIFKSIRALGQRMHGIDNNVLKEIGFSLDKEQTAQGYTYSYKYDLFRDAGSGMKANIPEIFKKVTNEVRANEKIILKIDLPVKAAGEMLTKIRAGNVAAIQVPSMAFLGGTDQDQHDILKILDNYKVSIIIGNHDATDETPEHQGQGLA